MRRATASAAAADEGSRVIVLVAAHGAAWFGIVLDHVESSRALCGALRYSRPRIDDEPIAVLRRRMPHVADFRLLAGAFAKQSRVGVHGRGMHVVLAFLAVKVAAPLRPPPVSAFPGREGCVPSAQNFSCWPTPQSGVHQPRSARLDKSCRTCDGLRTMVMNLRAISPSRSRSRPLRNTVASHTGSSAARPTSRRNNDCDQAAASTVVPIVPYRSLQQQRPTNALAPSRFGHPRHTAWQQPARANR